MFRVSLLCLAYFGIVMAVDDVTMISVCEIESPNEMYFDLSNMGIDTIRKSFVSGASVNCVNLAGNRISRIEKGAFDGLPKLSYLNLAMNPVSFEDFMKMSFPSLRTLVLDGPFSSIDTTENEKHDPSSSYYNSTNYSRMTNNRLFWIHPIFLPSLQKLSLSNYGDSSVSTWLNYFIVPNLTHLYISNNTFIQANLPKNFTKSLTQLNMNDNRINRFAIKFPKLRYLSMDRNQIENVCNQNCNGRFLSIRDMPELEHLSLEGNKIITIKTGTFDDSINLRLLNLAKNQITYLPRHVFNGITSLKNLSLMENALKTMPDVCVLEQLEVLSLRRNQISTIDDTSFCNLTDLSFIDISHNILTRIPDGTFEQLSRLTILDLSWNNIAALPEKWIRSGQVLHSLNLSGNLFENTDSMSLNSIGNLDTLSIEQNPLKIVSVSLVAALQPDMKIDVSRVYHSKLHKP